MLQFSLAPRFDVLQLKLNLFFDGSEYMRDRGEKKSFQNLCGNENKLYGCGILN
jgi:hypothetical protein